MTSKSNEATGASERRTCHRRPVSGRSAVWFDEGPSQGIVGTIFDLSMSGFSVRLLDEAPEGFRNGATIYCVLLIQGACIDCLATIRSMIRLDAGDIQIGFSIESLSDDNSRLLSGVLHYLEGQKGDQQESRCALDGDKDCHPSQCVRVAIVWR